MLYYCDNCLLLLCQEEGTSASASADAGAGTGAGAGASASASAYENQPLQPIIPPRSTASAQAHSEGGANTQSAANAIATRVTSAIARTFTNAENGSFVPLPQGKKPKRPRRKAIDTPRGKLKPWVSNVPLPEIWGPPPSWKGNTSLTEETLIAASQTARYRETFNILGSQELVHAPPSFRGQSEKGKEGSCG